MEQLCALKYFDVGDRFVPNPEIPFTSFCCFYTDVNPIRRGLLFLPAEPATPHLTPPRIYVLTYKILVIGKVHRSFRFKFWHTLGQIRPC